MEISAKSLAHFITKVRNQQFSKPSSFQVSAFIGRKLLDFPNSVYESIVRDSFFSSSAQKTDIFSLQIVEDLSADKTQDVFVDGVFSTVKPYAPKVSMYKIPSKVEASNTKINKRIVKHERDIKPNVFNMLMGMGKGVNLNAVMDLYDELPKLCEWITPIYFENIVLPENCFYPHLQEAVVEKTLEKDKSNIDMGLGREEMPGINTSMFYVGSNLSFSQMHVEDGKLESLNLVYFNLYVNSSYPSKAWIVVSDRDFVKFTCTVHQQFEDAVKIANAQQECSSILNHKSVYVATNFLRESCIEFDVILQYPGDVVYIKSGAYHQVININANVAEAINYGSSEWNAFTANHALFCLCAQNKLRNIDPNPEMVCVVKSRKVKIYICQMEDCGFYSSAWKYAIKHCKTNHTNTGTESIKKLYDEYPERKRVLRFCDTCKMHIHDYKKHEKSKRHKKSKSQRLYAFL